MPDPAHWRSANRLQLRRSWWGSVWVRVVVSPAGSTNLVVGHVQADTVQVPPLSVNGLPLTLPLAAGPGGGGLWGQIQQQWWLLILPVLLVLWKLRRTP